MVLRYDPPSGIYVSRIPPGVTAFRRVTAAHFGFTRTEVVRDKARCEGQSSEHCECRATDFFTTDLTPQGKGRRFFEWCVSVADPLGIQSVIFNRRVWGFGDWRERPYHGQSPHTDHVHTGFNKWAAANLTDELVTAYLPGGDDDMDADDKKTLKEINLSLKAISRALTDGDAGQTLAEQGGTNQRLDRMTVTLDQILAELRTLRG